VVLWLERRQNGDIVEWWVEWLRLRLSFYSSVQWKTDSPERVAYDSGADQMLQFRLLRGGDRTKCCRKMKRIEVVRSSWLNGKEE
jgi:hypothetical protein